ncbi:MAG TPA: LmbU family transcriptional regulator [Streptosporangiaceae bacterium]|nr:LmbU family transcriptional regulator [Streptosporangiaceae bacterium]
MTSQQHEVSSSRRSLAGTVLKISSPVVLRSNGLLFARRPSLQSWNAIGEQLIAVADSSTWWIADWLAFGESTFKDRYLEAAKKTQLNYQTLRNYTWVARRFELSRRRDSLTFGHHAEVAALDPPEQDYWLRKAEDLGWSRNKLRCEVRESLRERQNDEAVQAAADCDDSDGVCATYETLRLQVTAEQVEAFTTIAGQHELALEEWAISVLQAATDPMSEHLVIRELIGTARQKSA